MSGFQYCAACLLTGVKMQNAYSRIWSVDIVEAYWKIIEIPVEIYNCTFCYECARLLAKYEEFRSKCRRAQSLLSTIGTMNTKEIYEHIQTLNRQQNRLVSNLSPSQTKHHDNQTPITDDDFKPVTIDEENIKMEIEEADLNEFNIDSGYDLQDTYKLDSMIQMKRKRKKEMKLKKKPNEISKLTEECLSDDEPLANKVTKNTDIYKIKEIDTKNIKQLEEFSMSTSEKLKVYKRTKDCDFEEYDTVVFLSPEDAKKEVLLRKESSNYINSPLKCNLCYRGYEAKAAFENHMKKHSIEYGEFQCDICQLRFPQKRYLCKHQLASHRRKFSCKLCPYVCFCMHQAKTHVSLHKGKKYPCKECREVFSMPNSLLMHKRLKHGTECVCELCGHTFATPRGLYSHHTKLHRQHTNEKLGPKCDECCKHFATDVAWKIHLVLSSKHHVSNGCKFCGETFDTSQELKSHIRVHARKHIPRSFMKLPAPCSMCEKWLNNRAEYRSHISSVHPNSAAAKDLDTLTPFVCEVCGKMFKKQCFLTYHQRKHSGERPYRCLECDKTFQLAGALTTHKAVHMSKRAHKCGICSRVFTFKSVLNKHMKVHLGIRPHRCDICDKSFISPCDVKVHIKYVHNKVPWPKKDRSKLPDSSVILF